MTICLLEMGALEKGILETGALEMAELENGYDHLMTTLQLTYNYLTTDLQLLTICLPSVSKQFHFCLENFIGHIQSLDINNFE